MGPFTGSMLLFKQKAPSTAPRDRTISVLYICIIGISFSSAGLGYSSTVTPGLLSNATWLANETDSLGRLFSKLLVASGFIGIVVGAVAGAHLADRIGRRWSLVCASTMSILISFAQLFATVGSAFLVTNVLLGFVSAAGIVASITFTAELSPLHRQAQLIIAWSATYYVGAICGTWVIYASTKIQNAWSWRLLLLGQVIWPLVTLLAAYNAPETPSWQIAHGRPTEARKLLAILHLSRDPCIDDCSRKSVESMLSDIEVEQYSCSSSWSTFLRAQFRARTALTLFLALPVPWLGNNLVRPVLAQAIVILGITTPIHDAALNSGLNMLAMLMMISGGVLVNKIGRKTLLISSACGMLLTLFIFAICSGVTAHSVRRYTAARDVALMFIFNGMYCFGVSSVPIVLIAGETHAPTRAKAIGLFWSAVGVSLCGGIYLTPIALAKLQWRFYLVSIAVLVVYISGISAFVSGQNTLSSHSPGVHPDISNDTRELPSSQEEKKQAIEGSKPVLPSAKCGQFISKEDFFKLCGLDQSREEHMQLYGIMEASHPVDQSLIVVN